jgi:zinc transporter, ZIP family
MKSVWIAMGLTVFAGLATGIGSIIAFTAKRTNYRFLSVATGFSGGVMLYVSFMEILPTGDASLVTHFGTQWGHWINIGAFFAGLLIIGFIDNVIPEAENPHETHEEAETMPLHIEGAKWPEYEEPANQDPTTCTPHIHDHHYHDKKLMRLGLFTALAIGIHNFPEGLATFLAALQNPNVGFVIAIAVALHNIPEGISVSVPIFYATGNRRKAFVYSLLSGLAEPVGAAFAYLVLRFFLGGHTGMIPAHVTGILFAGVAGIMVYISLDELLPTSRAYGKGHDSVIGLVAGMLIMALSLLLMN